MHASLVRLLLVTALYFLPTLIGHKKANVGAIFVLNLLLGWTIIGWIVALVWALKVDSSQAPTVVVNAAAPPQGIYCSSCGKLIESAGRFCSGCGSPVR